MFTRRSAADSHMAVFFVRSSEVAFRTSTKPLGRFAEPDACSSASTCQIKGVRSARHLHEAKRLGVAKHSGLNRMAHERQLFTISIALSD
jgi:hypothetical protein